MLKLLQPICIFLPQLWVNMFIKSLQQRHSFIKSHHVLLWVWQGKVKKMEQNQPHLRLKKGLIIIYQEVGGGELGGYHLHHDKFYLIPLWGSVILWSPFIGI